MNFRKFSIVFAVLVLGAGIGVFSYLSAQKTETKEKPQIRSVRTVPVTQVEIKEVHLRVPFNGRLRSIQEVDLFAEVTGVLERNGKPFKEGVEFKKGELLIRVDDSEERNTIRAQRSSFKQSLVALLPDLKLDYPEIYPTWKEYVDNFNINEKLPPLPPIKDQRSSYFFSNRNIENQYYTIQAREDRLRKYSIYAPFDGVLSNVQINRGALVRSGQPIGTFIETGKFELPASIEITDAKFVKPGDKAVASFGNTTSKVEGKVLRISSTIDANTQTLLVYIEFSHPALREGLYGEGDILTGSSIRASVIPRSILLEGQAVWKIKNDSLLQKNPIEVVRYVGDSAIIKNIEDGSTIVARNLPDLYEGQTVKPSQSDQGQTDLTR